MKTVRVTLCKAIEHEGQLCAAGALLVVDSAKADWLIATGAAQPANDTTHTTRTTQSTGKPGKSKE